MRHLVQIGVLLGALAAASSASGQLPVPKEPIKKVDVMRLVGRPVLDHDEPPAGIHVWIHEGAYYFGAVARPEDLARKRKSAYTFRLQSSAPLRRTEMGRFRLRRLRGGSYLVTVSVGVRPLKAKFETEGEIVLANARAGSGGRDRAEIYLGPVHKRAASTVRIGRY